MKTLNLILVILIFSCGQSSPTKLTIANKGSIEIDSVEVFVTGNSYTLKELEKDSEATINLNVTGESDIKISINGDSVKTVEVYLEPNSGGKVKVGITRDSLLYFSLDK